MPSQPPAAIVVDARGLRCPLPVLRLARALREAPGASRFELLSDDPATEGEVAAWSAETGCRVGRSDNGRTMIERQPANGSQ